jgi:hypothetical protein
MTAHGTRRQPPKGFCKFVIVSWEKKYYLYKSEGQGLKVLVHRANLCKVE